MIRYTRKLLSSDEMICEVLGLPDAEEEVPPNTLAYDENIPTMLPTSGSFSIVYRFVPDGGVESIPVNEESEGDDPPDRMCALNSRERTDTPRNPRMDR